MCHVVLRRRINQTALRASSIELHPASTVWSFTDADVTETSVIGRLLGHRYNFYAHPIAEVQGDAFPFSFAGRDAKAGFNADEIAAVMTAADKRGSRAPWLYWDSELYSLGEIVRAVYRWPNWLPIPVNSDHGPKTLLNIAPRELEAPSGVHLTMSALKHALVPSKASIDVRLLVAPWFQWMKAQGLGLAPQAAGTIAYVPHSLPGDRIDVGFLEEYLAALDTLPNEFLPVALSLHPHDIESGLHQRLREAGRIVVTAGNSSHPLFFLRWCLIARQFRYATSPRPGSELLLFHVLGGEFFKFGPEAVYEGSTLKEDPVYTSRSEFQVRLQQAVDDLESDLFSFPITDKTDARASYVALFTTQGVRMTVGQVRRLFLRKLFRVPRAYWLKWLMHYSRHVRKTSVRTVSRVFERESVA